MEPLFYFLVFGSLATMTAGESFLIYGLIFVIAKCGWMTKGPLRRDPKLARGANALALGASLNLCALAMILAFMLLASYGRP